MVEQSSGRGGTDARITLVTRSADVARERDEILRDLRRNPCEIAAKHFYDSRGAELFERICALPEYYPTRTELALLERFADRILFLSGAEDLVELGPGAMTKARYLLDALARAGRLGVYVPVEVNEAGLYAAAAALVQHYKLLRVHGIVADFAADFGTLPHGGRRLVAFLGGTIGNFRPVQAVAFLTRVGAAMRPGEHLLLGADLIKDVARLEAAYNDAQGVTAEFNRNILRVINAKVAADFDPEAWKHRAFYNLDEQWIEMRLQASRAQRVSVKGLGITLEFAKGEEILTEISAKYDRPRVEAMLAKAGFDMVAWFTDAEALFSLSLARRRFS